VNKKLVNEGSITKITKILCHENLELYGSKKDNIFCGFFTLFSTKIIAFHVIVFVNLWRFSNARIVVSSISFHSAMREHTDILTLLWEDVVKLETEAVNWWSLLYCANLRNSILDPFFSAMENQLL